ncbi:hypothetical protein [Cupriavidus pampae]|uniref:Uncharacterized protein n=1 Tax=Cupriavidus pampae TaxID=659251 RepID=A0ABM8XIV6_9BURK|nr:hypothetical protein [Cupriavidus pampae]CAG9180109.1 hypothetical protein LMG32289_04507 [Cupriavidus pampae]
MRTPLLTAAAAALIIASGSAAAAGVGLYVVPGIFFDDAGNGSSKIDPAFRPALDLRQSVTQLQERAQAHFKTLTPTIDSKNRLRTLALSMQVTRASRYQIDKSDGTTDIYLPLTLSLYFSNPMTGEVLQSFSQTRYDVMTVSRSLGKAAIDTSVANAYRSGFTTLMDTMLASAARQFNPYVVETRVADTWRGFVILDKGYRAGIGKGDVMNDATSEIRVEHAGADYAVAVPVLGTPKDGAVFSRAGTMALSDVKKPRVLALVSDGNGDLSDAVSAQLFTDKLGSGAPFATLPLNGNFSQVQASIDSNTSIGHEVSGKRALPDYFIRMVVPPARQYTLPTNLAYKTLQSYQAWAFAELLSRDGRVLYAADVTQRIDDTVTDKAGFNAADRREVVLKNALNDLAERFGKEVRFQPLTLKVTAAAADNFQIDDAAGALQAGDTIRVYHGIGKPGPLTEEALVPTWEATVAARDGSRVTATPVLPIAGKPPRPEAGDVVLVDSVAGANGGGQRMAFCPADKSQIGSVALDRFNLLAYAGAASAKVVMINPALADLVKGRVGGQSGFARELSLRPGTYDRCLEALYRVDPRERKCEDGLCAQGYNVRLAYRQRAGGSVVGQAILEHGFVSNGYPAVAEANDVNALQAMDLDRDTRSSLDGVMKQLLNPN